jgi:hypothetical protein
MTAHAVTSPFEPIVLEDDPAFDVKKEYQDELDYYYETHPNDMGYVPPKSLKESAVGFLGGIRNGLEKVVEVRDELYGYNDKTKGPRIHLKPVEEMEFLPGGMGGSMSTGFSMGGSVAPDFSLGPKPKKAPSHKEQPVCHKKEKGKKKLPCCSCRDTGCLDNPHHCKEEKKEKERERPTADILSSDPFGIGKGKRLF